MRFVILPCFDRHDVAELEYVVVVLVADARVTASSCVVVVVVGVLAKLDGQKGHALRVPSSFFS